jgi:hypothetical protein
VSGSDVGALRCCLASFSFDLDLVLQVLAWKLLGVERVVVV